MRSAIALVQLSIMLLASPAAAAADFIPACSTSAHVSWVPDELVEQVDEVVVTVTGCDQGEPVTLQVLTTNGAIPDEPLAADAAKGQARFDLRPYALGIEPIIGARVTLFGEEIEVLGEQENRGSGEQAGDSAADGSPLPATGLQGLATLVMALALILSGAIVLRRRSS